MVEAEDGALSATAFTMREDQTLPRAEFFGLLERHGIDPKLIVSIEVDIKGLKIRRLFRGPDGKLSHVTPWGQAYLNEVLETVQFTGGLETGGAASPGG